MQIAEYINKNCQGQRGIVYCAKRQDTVDLAHELKTSNINAVFVHGALTDFERKRNVHAWISGLAQIICATKSFGMGIDQKDVRFVLHKTFPLKVSRITFRKLVALGEMANLHCVHYFLSTQTDHFT